MTDFLALQRYPFSFFQCLFYRVFVHKGIFCFMPQIYNFFPNQPAKAKCVIESLHPFSKSHLSLSLCRIPPCSASHRHIRS